MDITFFTRQAESQDNRVGYLGLLMGVTFGSLASILTRLAQDAGMPSPLIASIRLTLAALIITPIALRYHRDTIRTLTRRQIMYCAFAGFWLGIHFLLFITSLENTTVLITMVLVTTTPLWTAGLEMLFLRVVHNRMVWLGMACAIGGGAIIAIAGGSDAGAGSNPILGAALALAGAGAVSVYMFIGRKIQHELPLIPYIWMVYGFGGAATLVFALGNGLSPTGHPTEGYFWLLMITLMPQLLGHSSINFALRYFSATFVSIGMQSVVIGSSVIALFLFDEVPGIFQLLGSATIIVGVLLASLGKSTGRS